MIAADVRMLRSCSRQSRFLSAETTLCPVYWRSLTTAQARVASVLKYLEEWRDDLHGVEKSRSNVA
jgi:hypothetical protein